MTLEGAARRVRRAARRTRRKFGRATAGQRLLPTFLIIGAARSGTTSLYWHLLQHPAIFGSWQKELHFFDFRWGRGVDWYRAHFPLELWAARLRRRGVEPAVGEATPYYMYSPLAPARVRELNPAMKLLVLVRDPVSRAYSAYHDAVLDGNESLSFEEAIDAEPARIAGEEAKILADPSYVSDAHVRQSYLSRGLYLDQIERWLEHFPREQLHVIRSEDLFAQPETVLPALYDFLGVPQGATQLAIRHSRPVGRPPQSAKPQSETYEPMRPETRARLVQYFAGPNRRLEEFLGRDLGWPKP